MAGRKIPIWVGVLKPDLNEPTVSEWPSYIRTKTTFVTEDDVHWFNDELMVLPPFDGPSPVTVAALALFEHATGTQVLDILNCVDSTGCPSHFIFKTNTGVAFTRGKLTWKPDPRKTHIDQFLESFLTEDAVPDPPTVETQYAPYQTVDKSLPCYACGQETTRRSSGVPLCRKCLLDTLPC